jgi:hypothetical protein
MTLLSTSSFDRSHVPQPTLPVGVGISLLTDPVLAMIFWERVLKWVVILLITPRFCILCPPCQFLRTLFPWRVPIYPRVFHMEGTNFMVHVVDIMVVAIGIYLHM